MSDLSPNSDPSRLARRAFWASAVFYILIAFEFFYMASPFAAYLYAVYGPGLDWLQSLGPTNWTIRFFLPHAIEASHSPIVPLLEILGIVLFLGGVAAFAVGAFQVYRAKLLRKDAVVSGLYRHIRHPQYLALIVASIGMLLVWPRFLVLILTVTVVFIYIALARTEEKICLAKFDGYADYMARTGMFLPRGWLPGFNPGFGDTRAGRIAGWVAAYVASMAIALGLAFLLRYHATQSLVAHDAEEGVYLAVADMPQADLARAAEIAKTAPEVAPLVADATGGAPIIGYVLPDNMYVSEVPMFLPPGESFGHSVPADADGVSFKVIFTKAILPDTELRPDGVAIVRRAVNKTALAEVHVSLASGVVTQVLPPPEQPFYRDHQVPLF